MDRIDEIKSLIESFSSPLLTEEVQSVVGGTPLRIDQYKAFLEWMETLDRENLRVFEVGAFVGLFFDFMNNHYPHVDMEGIELRSHLAEVAQKHGFRIHTGDMLNVTEFVPPHSFDIVVAIHFFHRWLEFDTQEDLMKWIREIFAQFHYVLAPEGFVYLTDELFLGDDFYEEMGFAIESVKDAHLKKHYILKRR